ncbi:MAG: hypothetical protein ACI8P3_002006 [Saprospiraceae bacterium]|jgi:hypothetical protein
MIDSSFVFSNAKIIKMWHPKNTTPIPRAIFILALLYCSVSLLTAQDLFPFIDACKTCNGKVKSIKTIQKVDFNDYQSPLIYKIDEYNSYDRLVKTEISIDRYLSKTIYYGYKDSLLIYEHHLTPNEEEFFLVYQYYRKKIPGKIVKVNNKKQIIQYAELKYSEDFKPIYLHFYNLLGEVLEKRSVEYSSNNQVVIRYFNPKNQQSILQRFELLCKYNQPEKLKKKDFKDLVTKPLNFEIEDKLLRVVKAVKTENREEIQIEEVSYDDAGNWLSKKTFELKKNKNKRRLIKEIKREIVYY